MSVRTNFRGYERDSYEDLGKQITEIDVSTPVGKVIQNRAMTMITSGDYKGVANMLNVYKAVKFKDGELASKPVPVTTMEVIIWTDANGNEKRTETDASHKLGESAGWKFEDVCQRTYFTDGSFNDSK
tara:strand:- start:2091 stop:2474 length:384 start_codon:yes stop_codon:yes gene_type:complete